MAKIKAIFEVVILADGKDKDGESLQIHKTFNLTRLPEIGDTCWFGALNFEVDDRNVDLEEDTVSIHGLCADFFWMFKGTYNESYLHKTLEELFAKGWQLSNMMQSAKFNVLHEKYHDMIGDLPWQ